MNIVSYNCAFTEKELLIDGHGNEWNFVGYRGWYGEANFVRYYGYYKGYFYEIEITEYQGERYVKIRTTAEELAEEVREFAKRLGENSVL